MENSIDSSPLILAIDTSAGRSCAAVWKDGALTASSDAEPGQQSRTLVVLIEKVLQEAGVDYAALDAVACTLGPGGFTSVRVGVATARAIALAARKPLIGVNSLEVMAFASRAEGDVVAVIDAHRQQFYVQRFRLNGSLTAQSDPLLVEEMGLKALAHGARRLQNTFDAADVAALAHALWREGKREFPCEPLYLREPDAKLPA